MRTLPFSSMVAASLLALLSACGGITSERTSGPSPQPTPQPHPTPEPLPQQLVGQIVATTAVEQWQQTARFEVDLQPMVTVTASCAGASMTVGSCCYFAPTPPPLPSPGGGGQPAPETSAGTITLLDATSSASIGTFAYTGAGYRSLPVQYPTAVWQAGDTLQVSAAGDQIGAFTVSAPALIPPVAQVPPITHGQGVEVSWQPDPNADTMLIQVLGGNGQVVACVVPDATGTVAMDPSLYATFSTGARCQVAAVRQTDRYAQTPTGRVVFKSIGWASFDTSVQ